MNPEQWHIRSLRRFEDGEIALAIYLCIGGILSFLYTAGAIWNSKLYMAFLNGQILGHYELVLKVGVMIIFQAIARVIIWAPDLFLHIFLQHQSILDWLFATDILKNIS